MELSVDFLAGASLSSRLIEWSGLGYGGYSHCASVLSDGRYLDARDGVLAGVPAGVHIRHPETERCVRKMRATIQVTQTQYDDWEANLRAKIGDGYAFIDIVGFITGRSIKTVGVYDCSQLAINALQHIKVFPYPLFVEAHQVSPNSLLLMMQAVGARLTPQPPVFKV